MSGTFSSLTGALSALRYNQTLMDVASGNVANAGTDGYTRRRVIGQTVGPPAVPALWSRWDGAGIGVTVGSIDRMVDPFLEARARTEHGTQSALTTRSDALVRFESILGEPGKNGVAAALTAFKLGWHDVANNAGDEAARGQLLGLAETLASTANSQARAAGTEWSDQRSRLDALSVEVNDVASTLAQLNETIKVATVAGTDTNALLDQRGVLSMRLAEAVGGTVVDNPDGTVDVTVGGATLVDGTTAHTFAVSGADELGGPGGAITFTIDGDPATLTSGTASGLQGVLNDTLPDYLEQLDTVMNTIADAVNDQHAVGYDLDGNPGGDFFTVTDGRLEVAITDPRAIAASDVSGTLGGSNATAIAELDMGANAYRALITDFGSQVASARRTAENQTALTGQVDASRESLSGVNLDEEMVNLMAAQRAYEGASRVITTIDSMLDTLINRTGLVR